MWVKRWGQETGGQLMLQKFSRRVLRIARRWITEQSSVEKKNDDNYGSPPFGYADLNNLFANFVMQSGRLPRPDYAWGAFQSINLAKVLELKRVSFIEFGVAGGNGLVALEHIAQKLEAIFNVEIDIYGFDAVSGMPQSRDHRDLPNLWRPGHYPMNEAKLKARLKKARLVLGPVENTVGQFIASSPSPIAFIAFDLCFYSSTIHAFQLFNAEPAVLLPRVHCFFRNILGRTFGDYNGERLAISDFNASHEMRKISKIYGLQYYLRLPIARQRWVEQFYMAHIFDHALYGCYDRLIRETTRDLQDE
jgi:hypothetical protein